MLCKYADKLDGFLSLSSQFTPKNYKFKILHGYITKTKTLFQMSKVVYNKCSFCEMYRETADHELYNCSVVRKSWPEK